MTPPRRELVNHDLDETDLRRGRASVGEELREYLLCGEPGSRSVATRRAKPVGIVLFPSSWPGPSTNPGFSRPANSLAGYRGMEEGVSPPADPRVNPRRKGVVAGTHAERPAVPGKPVTTPSFTARFDLDAARSAPLVRQDVARRACVADWKGQTGSVVRTERDRLHPPRVPRRVTFLPGLPVATGAGIGVVRAVIRHVTEPRIEIAHRETGDRT